MTALLDYRGLDSATPVQPMDDEESHAFISLSLLELKRLAVGMPPSAALVDSLMGNAWPSILAARLRWAGVPDWQEVVTPEVILVIANLRASDSPGSAVMWAYTLLLWRVEAAETVTMNVLALRMPMGFPTEEAGHEAWDKQKRFGDRPAGSTDNWLDCRETWEPLVARLGGSL